MDKIVKIWCQTCLFCFTKYPIPICIVFSLFLSYMFSPSVLTFLICSFPLLGLSFLVHRVFLGVDRQNITRVEDDRKRKFAKSRRSFKSIYGDRHHLIRRNVKEKNDNYRDTNVEDKDAVLSTIFNDHLVDKTALIEEKPKEIREVNVESTVGKGDCPPLNDSQSLKPEIYDRADQGYQKYGDVNGNKDELGGESLDVSDDEDDEPQDKAVRWTEDDQKNVMDLGILETERNKRLESLMERRRSRKDLSFQDRRATGNNNNGQISAIRIPKQNPFLEDNSSNKNPPGSAPSSLLPMHNPFDLPYDPHEEKPDLTGDGFEEEFKVGHQKEPIFCKHGSFRLGTFSHPETTHDKHEMSFYKRRNFMGLGTSVVDNGGDYKHIQQYSLISDSKHPKEMEVHHDSYDCGPSPTFDERKADINFFYGVNKQVCHAPSGSIVSDLQVEVSDGESSLNDWDIEEDKESWLNSSRLRDVHGVTEEDALEVGFSRNGPDPLESNTPTKIIDEHNAPDLPEKHRRIAAHPSHDHSSVETEEPSTSTEKLNLQSKTNIDHVNDPEICGNGSQENIKTVADVDSSSTREMDNKPQSLNADVVQSNNIHETLGASQCSVDQGAPDGLTQVAIEQASVTSSSPESALQTDQASPSNIVNEERQSDHHTSEADSSEKLLPDSLAPAASENGSHYTNNSGENPFNNRDPHNLEDQYDHRLENSNEEPSKTHICQ